MPPVNPESQMLSIRDVTILLVKQLAIHEGLWILSLHFMTQGVNAHLNDDLATTCPAMLTRVDQVGLQRVHEAHPMAVDAAVVNPVKDLGHWDDALRELR